MADLALVPAKELIEELDNRFDSVIFYGMKDKLASVGTDNMQSTFFYGGDIQRCIALCELLKWLILNELDETKEIEED